VADSFFPKISLDPSKIKNRWALGALGLLVWLVIAYAILTKPILNPALSGAVLLLTFILLVLALIKAFGRDQDDAAPQNQSPNIQPVRTPGATNQKPTAEEIAYVAEIYELTKSSEVRRILDVRFKGKRR
jgi:hypothetical protein